MVIVVGNRHDGFFSLGEATSLEKENSELKPVKLRLKIDLVSYPTRAEGLGKYDMIISKMKKIVRIL